MGLAAIPVIWGSNEGVRTMFNAPLRWIPRDSASREEFNRFLEQFESHEIALVSWPGCTVDDPRQEEVADALTARREQRAAAGKPELYNQVLTGYTLLRGLMNEPADLQRETAMHRLQGTLVGPDGVTSCVIVVLTDYGALARRETLAIILDTVETVAGFPREELHLAGPPVDGIAIDDESIRSLQQYSLPAIVISLILCCLCLRSTWLTLPILAVGALGQAATLAATYFLGITMNAVLIVLPPLVFVLTVSAGVHLVNYFYDALRTSPGGGATTSALLKAWGPCALAAVTTAIGLASLTVSEVFPVRQFGVLAASGVLLTTLLLFVLLPGAMEARVWFAQRMRKPIRCPASGQGGRRFDFWKTAANIVWRSAGWISLGCLLLLLGCGAGLFRLRSSINVVSLLDPQNRAVRDFRWFEKHVGPLVPVEVVIHFDDACTLDKLQRMELVRVAQGEISKIDILDGAMSAASFLPPIPAPQRVVRRTVIRRLIEERQDELIEAQYLDIKKGRESWRISARILGQDDFDYGLFLKELEERVSPVIAAYEQKGYRGISASYTGVTAVVYEVEKALLADLFDSFLSALVLVTLVMMIALRSIRAGLVAMVPNVFPTIILFGAMGWLGRPVDIGTVMTASVALGIAVDGTFHFLKWYRHELTAGKTPRQAVAYSYQHCGRALTQTTVICALGLLVFALSGFLPARHFAVMMLLLMVAALIGDLVVLPSLLIGPLGKSFIRQPPRSSVSAGKSDGSPADEATCSAGPVPGGTA
jgi:predicted RND superfamily exporter protein